MQRRSSSSSEQSERDQELQRLVRRPGRRSPGATRSAAYVLDDRRVKDHRTSVETSNVESVLDKGDLDPFIDAELRRRKKVAK